MKKITFSFLFIFCASYLIIAQSPGNVPGNLQLWLRADQGTALTGTDVDSWTDQANGFLGASQGSTDAQYVATGLNFNPVLRFSGNSFYNLGNPSQLDIIPHTETMTIITMVVTGGATTGTVISKAENDAGPNRQYQVWFGQTDRVLHHTLGRHSGSDAVRWGTIYALNEPKITTGVVANTGDPMTRLTPYVNGVVDPDDRNDGTNTGADSSLDVLVGARRQNGNTGSGYRYNGDIAEVIIYDRDLNSTERQKVESYLAIKYGVTLGSNDAYWDTPSNTSSPFGYAGTSNDYLASNGSILWNGGVNAGYGYNVFGIARDDNSNLLQTKSKSVNVIPEPILTMESETGGLSTNLSYLLAGNNGNNVALKTTALPIRSTSVLERIWIARESTNDAGTVSLEFDLSTSSITDAEATNLDLFIADNDAFVNYKNTIGTYNSITDILTFTGINFEDAEYFTLGTPEVYNDSYHMEFDGVDDYVSTPVDLSGEAEATISAWFKRDNNSDASETGIIGQIGVMGIHIQNDDIGVRWGGNAIGYGLGYGATSIGNTNESWHHVAASFDNGYIKLYFDGELLVEGPGGAGNTFLSSSSNSFNIGGQAANQIFTRHFDGLIDEVRVFDVALTDEQVQQMVYQEIENNGGNVRGTIIPKDIEDTSTNNNILWSDLLGYYPMTKFRGNCLLDETPNNSNGRLYDLPTSTIQAQTAPMPYETANNGAWITQNTWLHGDIWDIEDLPNKDWAIVQIHHSINTSTNHTHLGLFVDSGRTLTINGTNELNNTWYLDLDGTIDLQDDSQLVQTTNSDLEVTSAGRILRRQEGTNNTFRYNYWASPVGIQNTTSNNNDFNLNMLDDSLGDIQFTTAFSTPVTTPATLSSRWFYTYQNGITYWNWTSITSLSNIPSGVGYIHKGPGIGATDYQYVFNGKPNNGTISINVTDVGGPGSVADVSRTQYLLGNPYASAIDAHKFIDDNVGVSNGTLYFWEQWSGSSHYLNEYEGGYATLNKLAKVAAYQFVGLSGADNGSQDGTKIPTQFIPVGQGFMTEIVANGTIEFNNTQRIFKQETLNESEFFRTSTEAKDISKSTETTGNEFKIIKLQFKVSNDLSRELVLGFSSNTSDDFDYGYDSEVDVFNTNDLATLLNADKMVIQAFSSITKDKEVDLVLNSDSNYTYTIILLETENIDDSQDIYLFDSKESVYHNLKDNDYTFTAQSGEDATRFKLVFKNSELLTTTEVINEDVLVYFNNLDNKLFVKGLNDNVMQLSMINILGQTIMTLGIVDYQMLAHGMSLTELNTGVYIVKLKMVNGSTVSKKVSIN